MLRCLISLSFLGLHVATPAYSQDNFTRFRGTSGNGVAEDDLRLPDTWDKDKNVQWKAAIPGWGWSSPVVLGDRVYVSSVYSDDDYEFPGAGLYNGRGRAEPPDSVHHWMVYCLDFNTGEMIWKKEAKAGKPQAPRHPKSTYASETPATDGERLYVLFGDVGMYCFSFDGELLWSHDIEPKKTKSDYGAAASPVVHNGQVIFVYDNQEQSWIKSLDAATGDEQWSVNRDEPTTWGSPYIWEHGQGTEIVTTGENRNRSYSLDGELLWHFDGKMSVLTIPSPFATDGLLYLTSGYFQDNKRPVFAVRPGARGDITLGEDETSSEHIAWSLQRMGPYNTTPIVYKGLYYTLLDRGMITCHDAKTGELVYNRKRFPGGASFTSSPWAYNGKLFFISEQGKTYVMPAGREFYIERTNELDELTIATPAVANGKLLIRTATTVYCIGNES